MPMRPLILLTLLLLLALAPVASASAAPMPSWPTQGTPPPDTPSDPGVRPSATASGSPWLGVLFFIAAGAIYLFVKSRLPANTITTNCCVPLIDPAKMEAEKKRIAEEEAS